MLKKIKTVLLIVTVALSIMAFMACAPKTESFTVAVTGGTGGGEYEAGSACTVTATVADGYVFLRWEEDGVTVSESNPYTFTVNKNVSLTAITQPLTPQSFTVTVTGGTGGGTFTAGTEITVTATVAADEKFVGWLSDGVTVSTDAVYTFTVEKDVDLTAVTAPLATAGVFEGTWVSADKTLNLTDMTLTGTEEFYLTEAAGEGAETVLSAVIDGESYTFSLNDDGRLELKPLSEGASATEFMPYDARFDGLWTIEDSDVYTLFISQTDSDGNFGWTLVNADGTLYDNDLYYTAKTRLTFEGLKPVVQFVSSANIVYVAEENGFIAAPYENLEYIPADNAFYDFYVTESGKNIRLDTSAKSVSLDGQTSDYTVTTCEYGSCLSFNAGGDEYALVYSLNGATLYCGETAEKAAKADLSAFTGEWVGALDFTVDGDNVSFGGATYKLKAAVKDNAIVFSFTADGVDYGLYPVGFGKGIIAVADMRTDKGFYCVSKSIAEAFKGDYGTLNVSSDYSVTLDGVPCDAYFTALTDFDRALTEPSGLEDIGLAALYVEEGSYLVWAEEGVLVLVEKSDADYLVTRAFYSAAAKERLKTALKAGLASETDEYTTGGADPVILSLDFGNGNVVFGGNVCAYEYGYRIDKEASAEHTALKFTVNGKDYVLYRYFELPYVVAENLTDDEKYSFVSLAEFSEVLDSAFVLKGAVVDESISFAADGTLSITEADFSAAGEAAVTQECDYSLSKDSSGVIVFTAVTFSDGAKFETLIYCAEDYNSLQSVKGTFIRSTDLIKLEAVGDYFTSDFTPAFKVLPDFTLLYNSGESLDDYYGDPDTFDTVTSDGQRVTASISYGFGQYGYTLTAVFENGAVTLTKDGETVGEYYKHDVDPLAFTGTYTITFTDRTSQSASETVVIGAKTDSVNEEFMPFVIVGGEEASSAEVSVNGSGLPELTFTVGEGKGSVSFSAVLQDGKINFFRDGAACQVRPSVPAPAWDLSLLSGMNSEYTLTDEYGDDYNLICVFKADGKVPVFRIAAADGSAELYLTKYSFTYSAGTFTVDVSSPLGLSVRISALAQGGQFDVGFTPYPEEE